MQKDFEQWLEVMIKHQQQQLGSANGPPQHHLNSAAVQNSRGFS